MGYETRIHVVRGLVHPGDKFVHGTEIAVIDLSKAGDGPVGQLIAAHTAKTLPVTGLPGSLYARNPDQQQEAVDFMKALSDELPEDKASMLRSLAGDIEDGLITKDCYGDFLGVIELTEMIQALEADLARSDYRRFWVALAMLKSIRETFGGIDLKIVTYGH